MRDYFIRRLLLIPPTLLGVTMIKSPVELPILRTIGVAGGKTTYRFLIDVLGADAAIDYTQESVPERLQDLCPNRVDVFFSTTLAGPSSTAFSLGWLRGGALQEVLDVAEGFDAVPEAALGQFAGRNLGKQLVRIAPES